MGQTTPSAILFWFFIYTSVTGSIGLMCYSCVSTKPFSDCESDDIELHLKNDSKFAINCSEYYNLTKPYCSIETHQANGNIVSIDRDCSDGESFSFDPKGEEFKKMKYLNPDTNVTICTFHQGTVCVSLCNEDMCNGPRSPDKGSSMGSLLRPINLFALAVVSYHSLVAY